MLVTRITLSDSLRPKVMGFAGEALKKAAHGSYERIAFAGRTGKGRSGITLTLSSGIVTGHKIDPIPNNILPLVHHVPKHHLRSGLEAASKGEDVLIGTPDHGIVLKWCGSHLEVYGAGRDSA